MQLDRIKLFYFFSKLLFILFKLINKKLINVINYYCYLYIYKNSNNFISKEKYNMTI